jgi:hypothetical protein
METFASISFSTTCRTSKNNHNTYWCLTTQPLTHHVWPVVPIMGTIEWPLVQWSTPDISVHFNAESATCAYC